MSPLLLRCPEMPWNSDASEWALDQLVFQWSLTGQEWQAGSIEAIPVVDTVVAFMPAVDVRLVELKMPLIPDKKLMVILPSLIEDTLLTPLSQCVLQLIPPLAHQAASYRLVAVMDKAWFKWLNQQLSGIITGKIQLLPELLAIPFEPFSPTVYFTDQPQHTSYTLRTEPFKGSAWKQALGSALPVSAHLPIDMPRQELTNTVIAQGFKDMDPIFRVVNLLPVEFYQSRKKNQAQTIHWGSPQLWQVPLRWVSICLIVIIVSKIGHLSYLSWLDTQWHDRFKVFASQAVGNSSSNALAELPIKACLSARQQGLMCSGEFLPMANQLDRILQSLPPDALKTMTYSSEGLQFELQPNIDPKRLLTSPLIDHYVIESMSASQFVLKPFAGLGASRP